MLKGLFTECDTGVVSGYFELITRVPQVGQEMNTLSGTPDFTPS